MNLKVIRKQDLSVYFVYIPKRLRRTQAESKQLDKNNNGSECVFLQITIHRINMYFLYYVGIDL